MRFFKNFSADSRRRFTKLDLSRLCKFFNRQKVGDLYLTGAGGARRWWRCFEKWRHIFRATRNHFIVQAFCRSQKKTRQFILGWLCRWSVQATWRWRVFFTFHERIIPSNVGSDIRHFDFLTWYLIEMSRCNRWGNGCCCITKNFLLLCRA